MSKILLVEDNKSLGQGIIYALEDVGFYAELAINISDANQYINKNKYDLILLDVKLPDGNGLNFCREIRKKYTTPIIFLTACDEEVNVVQGLDLGGDDYITKPFRVRELISRIRATLRRAQGQTSIVNKEMYSGDLSFFPLEQKVIKDGKEIFLTPIETKLLTIFMINPLQILSRTQILEKIWDIDGNYIDDNTLSVNIRRLRKKIEDDPSNPENICTIRGRGYRWNKRGT